MKTKAFEVERTKFDEKMTRIRKTSKQNDSLKNVYRNHGKTIKSHGTP